MSGTTAVDSSGHGNHGTGYNTVGTGRGYIFNGTSSRVVVPDAPALDPGAANFSFGVTLQMSAPPLVGETFDVLRKGITTTAGGNYKLEIVNSNGLAIPRCVIKDGLRVVAAVRGPVATVATGRPHTVTCHRVGNSVTIRVDGLTPKSTTVAQLGSISNASELGIGAKPEDVTSTGFDWHLGQIHDAFVRID